MFFSIWGSIRSLWLPCTRVLLPLGNHSLSFVTLYLGFAPFGEPFPLFRYPEPGFCSLWGTILSLSLPCTLVLLLLGNHSLSFVTLNPGFAPFGDPFAHISYRNPRFFFFCGSIHTLSLPRTRSRSQLHINFHPNICIHLPSANKFT